MKLFPVLLLVAAPVSVADVRDAQLRRLFEPTPADLRQEQAGRVYIYEGLTDADIAIAMEAEFDRVESMMFIRVPVTDDKGEVVKDPETGETMVQDDGC